MKKKRLSLWEEDLLDRQVSSEKDPSPSLSPAEWIRLLRTRLRLTQPDLANRAGMDQAHLARIEAGKIEPSFKTLQSIFKAMKCDLVLAPRPTQPYDAILLEQAREVALRRLKRSMGNMALEEQAPREKDFQNLLEKKAREILEDKRINLWRDEKNG